ncbi:MAG: putative glycosyltransferase (TIGR04348 family), partial [Planctomycetota bacterium]
ATRGSRSGNRVTALRWAGLLRQLGHRVTIATEWQNQPSDVLVTVHAVKSAKSVLAASHDQPGIRVVTLLAGTDIYPTFTPGEEARAALSRADALLALQPRALSLLPAELLKKSRTIVQSATTTATPKRDAFTATVIAHLRPIKQPHIAVEAIEMMPKRIDMRLIIAGSSLDDNYGQRVAELVKRSPGAEWVGALPRRATKQLIASCHICIVPSSAEGGANVVSEAIAAGTPILCTAIPGNLGLLGDDWPGVFPVGDSAALAALLERAATEKSFLDDLCLRTREMQSMVDPSTERQAWHTLLLELSMS